MMWTVEDFQDKLDMMRTGYAQYQNQQFSKTHDESILKTVDKEVFNSNAYKTITDLPQQFFPNPEDQEDLEELFQQPGKHVRNSIKNIDKQQSQPAKQEEQKQSEYIGIDDEDMAAFANLRNSESEKQSTQAETDPMDIFLQKQLNN